MQDVKIERYKYIGGSDIPCIMGISTFKKRFDLLLEKAQLKDNDFEGNEFTEYGNVLEPMIRDYINSNSKIKFEEYKIFEDDVRCHLDGFDGKQVLEIKTTSQIHDDVNGYKVYLVQLLFYMHYANAKKGMLAVYHRPKDFNTEFDCTRLQVFEINIKDYKDLLDEILQAVDQFRIDLEKVKANPFITEEDLQPKELITLSNQVVEFENKLATYKKLEEEYKSVKEQLYQAMDNYKVKKWTTNNGVQITKVEGSADTTTTVKSFNEQLFKGEHPELYEKYVEKQTITKKGRAGYLKITLPKGE